MNRDTREFITTCLRLQAKQWDHNARAGSAACAAIAQKARNIAALIENECEDEHEPAFRTAGG